MASPHALDDLRRSLHADAQVFDDPSAYLAGVEDALSEFRRLAVERHRREPHTISLPEPMAWFG